MDKMLCPDLAEAYEEVPEVTKSSPFPFYVHGRMQYIRI